MSDTSTIELHQQTAEQELKTVHGRLRRQIAGGKVLIEVRDNGRGIETTDGTDVFKMFARLHTEEEKEEAGTKLAVCKKIVDKHGGQIGVKSEAGAGSTFWFTLPASKDLQHDGPLLSAETGTRAGTTSQEAGS